MSMLARVRAEFWSAEDELKLINECPRFETSEDQAELEAWRLTGHLYNDAILSDLFTYGLRIGDISHTESSAFYQGLSYILAYPPLKGDLRNLRFVLQMIAYFKIEGHALPFGPILPCLTVMETFHNLRARYRGKHPDDGNREDEAALAVALWKDTNPSNINQIRDLLINLKWEVDQFNEQQTNNRTYSQVERQAFVIDAHDLEHLIIAMEFTLSSNCEDWLDVARRTIPEGTEPASLNHLETIKNRVAVKNERKYRLRKKLLLAQGDAADRSLHVFDVPDNDPDLMYVYAKDIEPGQLRVLVGEVLPHRYPICNLYYSTSYVSPAAEVGGSKRTTTTMELHVKLCSRPPSPDLIARSSNDTDSSIEIEGGLLTEVSPQCFSGVTAAETVEQAHTTDHEARKALLE